jgi:RecA-family ATPase
MLMPDAMAAASAPVPSPETIMIDLRALQCALGGEVSGGRLLCPGPNHSATDRSLSVKVDDDAPDGFLVHSFAGDDPLVCKDYVREKLGLPAFKPNGGNGRRRASDDAIERALMAAVQGHADDKPPKGRIIATYDYTDSNGALLFQVLRLEPKSFRQRRPDGNGGFVWSLGDVRRVPYRWPELLQFPDATVFVCEGEKDADRVATLGHCATAVAGNKWADDCVKALAGRDIIVLQDNDRPGREKALAAAQALHGTAKSIRIVLLPDLPDRGDLSDWLDADPRRAEKLVDICFDIAEWTPSSPTPDSTSPPPREQQKPAADTVATTSIKKLPPIQWLDMSTWDDEPRPEREWAILNRVPLNQAGLFSGEGGAGKSIIEMMKDVAHVTGKDWLGSLPAPGPAIYLGAEDDEKEIHIRFYDIATHYGVTFKELINGGLHVLCKLGQDATLCAVGKSGRVETTALYQQLYEAAGDIKPKNISIDTLSRAFAGNEIDRVQVYAFAMHMQALAMAARGAVTVLSHPSLQGISSGSGISGSTAWHGAFRFRQYLKTAPPDDNDPPDSDLRQIEFKKNQYGPIGETIVLRYRLGLFLPIDGMSTLEKLAAKQKADELFLELLDKFESQGRKLSHLKNAHAYAPTMFAKDPKAKAPGIHKALADAMERLFAAKKIKVESYGRPSNPHSHITRCHDEKK